MKSIWPRHRFFNIPQEGTVADLSALMSKVFDDLDETLKELFEHQIDLTQDVTGVLPAANLPSTINVTMAQVLTRVIHGI